MGRRRLQPVETAAGDEEGKLPLQPQPQQQLPNGKAEKFRSISTIRVTSALKTIRRIGNLSRRSSYDYRSEQIEKIFSAIRKELDAAEARFKPQTPTLFSWD